MENRKPINVTLTRGKILESIYKAFGFNLYENYGAGRRAIIRENEDQLFVSAASDYFTRELTLHFGGQTTLKRTSKYSGGQTTFSFPGGRIEEIYDGTNPVLLTGSQAKFVATQLKKLTFSLTQALNPLLASPKLNEAQLEACWLANLAEVTNTQVIDVKALIGKFGFLTKPSGPFLA